MLKPLETITGKFSQSLGKSTDFWRDYYLAGQSSTPAEKLFELAEHRDDLIRKRVAENLHLPMAVQMLLITDTSVNVRLALSANPVVLIEVLEKLVKDDSDLVRLSLARNKNLPVAILINLTRDPQTHVIKRAQKTIEEIFGLSRLSAA